MAQRSAEAAGRMEELVGTFPSLREAPGGSPWDALLLDEWPLRREDGSAALHAARFVLEVWDSSGRWDCGPFGVVNALATWDHAHKKAFLRWAADPWWP